MSSSRSCRFPAWTWPRHARGDNHENDLLQQCLFGSKQGDPDPRDNSVERGEACRKRVHVRGSIIHLQHFLRTELLLGLGSLCLLLIHAYRLSSFLTGCRRDSMLLLPLCCKEPEASSPLQLTGAYRLEGTNLASSLSASRSHRHS